MTTTTAFQSLLDAIAADAAGAADQAIAANRRLSDAAALVEARHAAKNASDAQRAADAKRRAAELRGMRHTVAMLGHAIAVADLVAAIGPALDAAEATARAANMATANGPLSTLRELRPKVVFYAGRRSQWAEERAVLAKRLAAEERADKAK